MYKWPELNLKVEFTCGVLLLAARVLLCRLRDELVFDGRVIEARVPTFRRERPSERSEFPTGET